jgi:hypothetical protein
MIRTLSAVLLAGVALLVGCVALGWRFGPGFAAKDTTLFAAPPVIVHRGAEYLLVWTHGTNPFFFEPEYRAMEGRLVFALVSTSSSGSLAGRSRELEIKGAENIAALQKGGAFWWERESEPDGTFVRLNIVEQPDH